LSSHQQALPDYLHEFEFGNQNGPEANLFQEVIPNFDSTNEQYTQDFGYEEINVNQYQTQNSYENVNILGANYPVDIQVGNQPGFEPIRSIDQSTLTFSKGYYDPSYSLVGSRVQSINVNKNNFEVKSEIRKYDNIDWNNEENQSQFGGREQITIPYHNNFPYKHGSQLLKHLDVGQNEELPKNVKEKEIRRMAETNEHLNQENLRNRIEIIRDQYEQKKKRKWMSINDKNTIQFEDVERDQQKEVKKPLILRDNEKLVQEYQSRSSGEIGSIENKINSEKQSINIQNQNEKSYEREKFLNFQYLQDPQSYQKNGTNVFQKTVQSSPNVGVIVENKSQKEESRIDVGIKKETQLQTNFLEPLWNPKNPSNLSPNPEQKYYSTIFVDYQQNPSKGSKNFKYQPSPKNNIIKEPTIPIVKEQKEISQQEMTKEPLTKIEKKDEPPKISPPKYIVNFEISSIPSQLPDKKDNSFQSEEKQTIEVEKIIKESEKVEEAKAIEGTKSGEIESSDSIKINDIQVLDKVNDQKDIEGKIEEDKEEKVLEEKIEKINETNENVKEEENFESIQEGEKNRINEENAVNQVEESVVSEEKEKEEKNETNENSKEEDHELKSMEKEEKEEVRQIVCEIKENYETKEFIDEKIETNQNKETSGAQKDSIEPSITISELSSCQSTQNNVQVEPQTQIEKEENEPDKKEEYKIMQKEDNLVQEILEASESSKSNIPEKFEELPKLELLTENQIQSEEMEVEPLIRQYNKEKEEDEEEEMSLRKLKERLVTKKLVENGLISFFFFFFF